MIRTPVLQCTAKEIAQNIFNRSMGILSNKFCIEELVFILPGAAAESCADDPATTSDFRIFSRGIVPPYRTTTGPLSEFRISTSDFIFPLPSDFCPLSSVLSLPSSVLGLPSPVRRHPTTG